MDEHNERLRNVWASMYKAYKEEKRQRMEQNVQMRQLVMGAIANLRRKAQRHVPEKGSFELVYEEFENPDNTINVSKLRIKVSPVGLEGRETMRFLEFAAFKNNCPYMAETVVCHGTKQEILNKLNSQELPIELLHLIPKLESDLEDI